MTCSSFGDDVSISWLISVLQRSVKVQRFFSFKGFFKIIILPLKQPGKVPPGDSTGGFAVTTSYHAKTQILIFKRTQRCCLQEKAKHVVFLISSAFCDSPSSLFKRTIPIKSNLKSIPCGPFHTGSNTKGLTKVQNNTNTLHTPIHTCGNTCTRTHIRSLPLMRHNWELRPEPGANHAERGHGPRPPQRSTLT